MDSSIVEWGICEAALRARTPIPRCDKHCSGRPFDGLETDKNANRPMLLPYYGMTMLNPASTIRDGFQSSLKTDRFQTFRGPTATLSA